MSRQCLHCRVAATAGERRGESERSGQVPLFIDFPQRKQKNRKRSDAFAAPFSVQMPEEEAFAVLLRLMDEYRLRELYRPAMTELGLCMFQLECLVQVR